MGKHNPQKTSSANAGIQHRVVTIYLLYEIANKMTFFSFPIIPHGSSGSDDQRELAKPSSLMADICDRDEPPNFLRVGRRNRYIRQLVVQSRLNGSK